MKCQICSHDKGWNLECPTCLRRKRDALLSEKALWIAQNEANAEDNEKLREVNRKQFERIMDLERREQALLRLIDAQPHHHLCETQYEANGSCDCWKSLPLRS